MRNHFRIESGGKTYCANNTVLSAFEHWSSGYAYARYLSVFSGERRIDKQTEVVSYNDDVLNGELFATYRVYLSEDEFPYDIDRLGLSPSEGGTLSNECVVSVPAGSMVIFATVYLSSEQDSVSLYPGSNALIRSLLGMESKPEFSVYGSEALLPNRPIMCDTDDYIGIESIQSSDGVIFVRGSSIDFAVGKPPVLRYNAAYDNLTESEVVASVVSGGAFLSGTADVAGVKKDGEAVSFGSFPVIKKLHPSGKQITNLFPDCKLINDPLYRHAAIVGNSVVYIIGDNGEITSKSCTGEPTLCSDGAILSKFGGFLYIDGNENYVTVGSGDFAALSREGGYDIFVYDNDTLKIYRYDGTLSTVSTLEVGKGYKLDRFSDFAVVLTGSDIRLFTYEGETEPYGSLLLMTGYEFKDGCFYGDTFMGNVWSKKSHSCTSAYGRFCNTSSGLFYVGEEGAVKVGDFTIDGAAIKGDTVYFLVGDRLISYVMEKSGTFVSVNAEGEIVCDGLTPKPVGTIITLRIKEAI